MLTKLQFSPLAMRQIGAMVPFLDSKNRLDHGVKVVDFQWQQQLE
jgi:hypothetical protein